MVTLLKSLVVLVVLFMLPQSYGQICTDGFLDPRNENLNAMANRLVPLLERDQLWVFPNMEFTCMGILTGWIFRAMPGVNVVTRCRVQLTTWRFDSSSISARFNQQSSTERNMASFNMDGSIFTYRLSTPAIVEPGDIIGVEIDNLCSSTKTFDRILTFNVSGIGSTTMAYQRSSSTILTLSSSKVFAMNTLIPLVTPIVLPTIDTPTGRPCIAPLTNSDSEGRTISPPKNDRNQPANPRDRENRAQSTSASGDGRNRPVTEEMNTVELEGEALSTVTIAASTVGGVIGLIVIVTLCVGGTVWLSRHLKVQMHYKDRQRRQETHDGHKGVNPFVPANLVERQTPDGISHLEHTFKMNKRSRSHNQNKNVTEGHRMTSHVNVAYLGSNPVQSDRRHIWQGSSATLLAERKVPIQQNVLMYDNNHGYDNDSYNGEQEVPTQQNRSMYDNDSDSYESVQ